MRPEHRSDNSQIEHELVHYKKQAWITPMWVLLYLVYRKFRIAAEVHAYTRQIQLGGSTREHADRIAKLQMIRNNSVAFGKA